MGSWLCTWRDPRWRVEQISLGQMQLHPQGVKLLEDTVCWAEDTVCQEEDTVCQAEWWLHCSPSSPLAWSPRQRMVCSRAGGGSTQIPSLELYFFPSYFMFYCFACVGVYKNIYMYILIYMCIYVCIYISRRIQFSEKKIGVLWKD